MKTITISESEYKQLQATILKLTDQLAKLQSNKPIKQNGKGSITKRLHGVLAPYDSINEKQILEDHFNETTLPILTPVEYWAIKKV